MSKEVQAPASAKSSTAGAESESSGENSTETAGIRVLAYGSLRKGLGNHRLLVGARFLGNHTIPKESGLRLVSLGWFPGVIDACKEEATTIECEAYLVNDEQLLALDMLEGNPDFYKRRKVETKWKKAWLYCLPAEEYGSNTAVESGDWVEWLTANEQDG
jgi:gamma-glutamylcyclotransferase (GGCT)/AIG2-like uncharacterized protein YtfP